MSMSICSIATPLAGQVAVVTGGSSGIGAATVRELTELGARVASVDLSVPVDSPAAATLVCDVTDKEQVTATLDRVDRELGPPDILVLCAGTTGPVPLTEFPDELWHRIYSVNVDGTFYFARSALSGMTNRGRGRIVLISSGAAIRPSHGTAGYASSKAAVIALGKLIAVEAAESGVTCNIIAPGLVATPMSMGFYGGDLEVLRTVATTTAVANAMKVVLEPQDIATMIGFLCLPQARYITGQTIHINGGSLMP
jgi:NAD(P)-dependent dehydrogenase (short-subunit alcohol dehydrogenase family)